MELPTRSIQDEIGESAVSLVKRRLPPEWIVRDQPKDFGIDLEVELVERVRRRVSGIIFKVQVRGHRALGWARDASYLQPVRQATLNYWREFSAPVVLFLVDVGAEQVFWASSDAADASGIRVHRASILPDTLGDLVRHIVFWMDARETRETVYRLPILSRRFERRTEGLCQADPWCALEQDELRETRDLYSEVLRLARAVGFNVTDALPWSFWLARSKKTWGDGEQMFWGTHDELMLYLKSFYDPAFQRACQLLEGEGVTQENADAMSFVEHLREGSHTTWIFHSAFDDLEDSEWLQLEGRLKERGALRISLADRVK